jgi:CheY-like chemotaxis protein
MSQIGFSRVTFVTSLSLADRADKPEVVFVEARELLQSEGEAEVELAEFVAKESQPEAVGGLVVLLTNPLIRRRRITIASDNVRHAYRPLRRSQAIKLVCEVVSRFKAAKGKAAEQIQAPVKVLVAEDNKINQMVIRRMLEGLGLECHIAPDGQEAVKTATKDTYDVILMDIMMPNLDGLEATVQIRKFSGQLNVPYVIGLSANAFWEDRLKAFEAGMNDFLTKPVTPAALKDAIAKGMSQQVKTRGG